MTARAGAGAAHTGAVPAAAPPAAATPRQLDPRPPRAPDRTGVVVRDGVRTAWAVHEPLHQRADAATVLLLPTWSIVPSRFWKLQVPFLARHHRVVTFDGRGSGASDRPTDAVAYEDPELAADAAAVLDATGTERAVVVGFSCGATWAVHLAAEHPERVEGIVAIAPSCGLAVVTPGRESDAFDAPVEAPRGWAKYNQHHWLEGGYDDFVDFFFAEMFPEAHSTKQVEDCVRWAHEITPEVLVATTAGRLGLDGARRHPLEPVCARVRCPVLVVHGTEDRVRSHAVGRRLAELTGGDLRLVEGAGHGLPARDPVLVNRLLTEFVDRVHPRPSSTSAPRAHARPLRALYLSSPIGLGHARRDVAIARELRIRVPGLRVDWLAQSPVTAALELAGERVHPGSGWLASESAHVEAESGEHDLHAFAAIRRMDEILVNNFHVLDDVLREEPYDLVIGDEAWDVDFFLHENPSLKRFAFAWLTDFVGWLPMAEGGDEARLTADLNAEMIGQRARFRRLRDRSVFVGDPGDVVDRTFGPGLPGIREWTADNFDFAGYVTGFEPPDALARTALRRRLGYTPDDVVCIVAVGGSGVGEPLIRRVLDAVPAVRRRLPGLKVTVVTGPRIDPAGLPRPRGVRLRGWVPDLDQQLAACDVAVVQGGLTTCMELTASRVPFVYVPLRHHFEQNIHVRHRLERHRAGRCADYDELADPDRLAELLLEALGTPVDYRPVATDGAARAAELIAEVL